MKRKKVRKPRYRPDMYIADDGKTICINFYTAVNERINLYYAKRLHAWLGRAIEYLEQREEEK